MRILGNSMHVLDLLRATFLHMGDREGITDPWMQRRVTAPDPTTLETYKNDLQIYIERYRNEPSPPQTIRQVFKKDATVLQQVGQMVGENAEGSRGAHTKLIGKLFDEAEKKPGGLDRFQHQVERDLERYAREMKEFKKGLRKFDEEHNLLPRHLDVQED